MTENIKTIIIEFLKIFPTPIKTIIIASLPVFELRLALPLALVKWKMGIIPGYFFSLLGNLLPVIPWLFILRKFFFSLKRLKIIGPFFSWWFKRVENKSSIVRRWEFWGLIIFVAIPLPVTGAWTGAVAATLANMPILKAFWAIAIGVAIAGIFVCLITVGVINIL